MSGFKWRAERACFTMTVMLCSLCRWALPSLACPQVRTVQVQVRQAPVEQLAQLLWQKIEGLTVRVLSLHEVSLEGSRGDLRTARRKLKALDVEWVTLVIPICPDVFAKDLSAAESALESAFQDEDIVFSTIPGQNMVLASGAKRVLIPPHLPPPPLTDDFWIPDPPGTPTAGESR